MSGTFGDALPGGETPPRLVIDVIACDGADTSSLILAAQSLGADVRVIGSTDGWCEQATLQGKGAGGPIADIAMFVGSGQAIVTQRCVSRAAVAAPDTRVIPALVDSPLDYVMSVVNQGADGLLLLAASTERVELQLRDLFHQAARDHQDRAEKAQHRRALATLTPAEIDVLDGMLAGMANKQIAQRLSIGLRTVELRRSKIMRKMRAKSLAQLISFICAAGYKHSPLPVASS